MGLFVACGQARTKITDALSLWSRQFHSAYASFTTVDGSEIPKNHLGCIEPVVYNGINYQPQLVSRISEPSTVWSLQDGETFHGGQVEDTYPLSMSINAHMKRPMTRCSQGSTKNLDLPSITKKIPAGSDRKTTVSFHLVVS